MNSKILNALEPLSQDELGHLKGGFAAFAPASNALDRSSVGVSVVVEQEGCGCGCVCSVDDDGDNDNPHDDGNL